MLVIVAQVMDSVVLCLVFSTHCSNGRHIPRHHGDGFAFVIMVFALVIVVFAFVIVSFFSHGNPFALCGSCHLFAFTLMVVVFILTMSVPSSPERDNVDTRGDFDNVHVGAGVFNSFQQAFFKQSPVGKHHVSVRNSRQVARRWLKGVWVSPYRHHNANISNISSHVSNHILQNRVACNNLKAASLLILGGSSPKSHHNC